MVQRLFIDLQREADTAPLVSMIVNFGVEVEEVRRRQASLEEAFLAIMEDEHEA